MNLSEYNDKKIIVYLKDGSTFAGFGTHNSLEYSYGEFGIKSEMSEPTTESCGSKSENH